MVKTILHLLKIHRKVIFGNPSVIVQDMLRNGRFFSINCIFSRCMVLFYISRHQMDMEKIKKVDKFNLTKINV